MNLSRIFHELSFSLSRNDRGVGAGDIVGAHHFADLDSRGGVASDVGVDGVVDVFGEELLAVVSFDEL